MKNKAAVALGRLGGLRGGKARMAGLSRAERTALGKKAASKRWGRTDGYFTTPADAVEDVNRHWKKQSAEARFLAVEKIREATYALYNNGRKLPGLARTGRFVVPSSR